MLNVILFEPEIPPNTGNIIRLCANTGAHLHLVEPLGFDLDDAKLRRAGLDYHEFARVQRHASLAACLEFLEAPRVFAFSARCDQRFDRVAYRRGDALLFGPETRGLPEHVLDSIPATQRLRIPMRPGQRSLNLSNAVAVCVFEAWRQLSYEGASPPENAPGTFSR
jgi:tRNA (cytidine/uridine-2'-O-)-methyltransferase